MLHLSRRVEYALQAVIDLAVESGGERVQLADIAARQAIPDKYLEQLLRPLKTAGVVLSARGSRGGYLLARPASQVTVLEVYEAIEGSLREDDEAPVSPGARAIRDVWRQIGQRLRAELGAVSIAELAEAYRAQRLAHDNWVI
ncbi:MAG: Rrf2 family transcriptional regulator [Fimbriimonadaceae bacterium]|nr:Rrf2 family transcriptional regulator [Fimbriimonadaceae bacterium]